MWPSLGGMMPMPRNLLLLGVCIVVTAAAQLLLKAGMNRHGPINHLDLTTLVSVFTNVQVVLAIVAYGISSLTWMVVLSRVPLNIASPLLTLSTITVALAATPLLQEPFTWQRFAGTLLTAGGAWLIVRSY